MIAQPPESPAVDTPGACYGLPVALCCCLLGAIAGLDAIYDHDVPVADDAGAGDISAAAGRIDETSALQQDRLLARTAATS